MYSILIWEQMQDTIVDVGVLHCGRQVSTP
jgi:hypothetical protein